MKIPQLHSWDLSPTEAVKLQRKLACRVETDASVTDHSLIAGADISFELFSDFIYAGVVVLNSKDLSIVERRSAVMKVTFPYIPGLLSFRELPPLLKAFARLETRPDVVMFDGHGLAHPRRFGLACHAGLYLQQPTLGCAKSRLIGTYNEPGHRRGCNTQLKDGQEKIGAVVRSKDGVKPLFVSVGHKIDLPSAVRIVLNSCCGYRLPEPTRQAHLYVNELRRSE